MRWRKKFPEREYNQGDTRTKRRFLFFPKCLPADEMSSDMDEWRWLEMATIKQICVNVAWKQRKLRTGYYYKFYWRDSNWE